MTRSTYFTVVKLIAMFVLIAAIYALAFYVLKVNIPAPVQKTEKPIVVIPIAPLPPIEVPKVPLLTMDESITAESVPIITIKPQKKILKKKSTAVVTRGLKSSVKRNLNEMETMRPSRSYCIQSGNPKGPEPKKKVCLERDEITKKIYRLPSR